ncbi:hypothetical protein BT63DRAFT_82716 [Microthyrium microscopicum]|uniref:Uncharacterized protein n=1 Tax=Microthyrium microscopicum TaxID=703497 RepID=A0A6A6U1L5_9PEZI|nr:hypothetical protein BT63DRAFT_82716 [Microthyrium microscopicum]
MGARHLFCHPVDAFKFQINRDFIHICELLVVFFYCHWYFINNTVTFFMDSSQRWCIPERITCRILNSSADSCFRQLTNRLLLLCRQRNRQTSQILLQPM